MLLKKAPLVGAFFVSACFSFQAMAETFCPAPSGLAQVQVRHVVDGDTLRLQDGRSVRLIGLNAPELGRKGRSDEPFAVAARQRLQALVRASDGRLLLQPGREASDKYGRTLAHLYSLNGTNLETQLLAQGLAYQIAVAPNVDRADCQRRAELQARAAGLGLWRRSPMVAASQVSQSGFALVSGTVGEVQRNRGGLWLNLSDSLVLHIAARDQARFDDQWLARYKGQAVEVRGWVLDRSRRGGSQRGQARWMLTLSDPSMLQLVH
ncbi:thermonuclease family protein [Pseudomonas sp. dw_358]|uniref:thermonuclease family protein n=1 Tax=Pseudomonas sp. dw_358 TaxID=2720083 RepID=UPI002115F5F5|nr:thermonuclease family protein [Pseudomonas sp. dw_358]